MMAAKNVTDAKTGISEVGARFEYMRQICKARTVRTFISIVAASAVLVACSSSVPSAQSADSHGTVTPQASNTSSSTEGTIRAAAGCQPTVLTVSVVFNSPGDSLGAVKLVNHSGQPCSLTGQPTVQVLDQHGIRLPTSESAFHQAPDLPPPAHPIILSASGVLPQAIVEMDLEWCGAPTGPVQFTIEFAGWQSPLTIPVSGVTPSGFTPGSCSAAGVPSLLAVDYVRGFGKNGIIYP